MSETVAPYRSGSVLPAELTSFVGRAREVAEVERLAMQSRLVTLTGMGGIGKTRLALQVAARLQERFRDGVRLVELSALRDPYLLPHAVAMALGLQDQTMRPVRDVIAEYVADKHLLLVLDTCEVQIEACAELAVALLQAAPALTILATSREVLGVVGESLVTVGPLTGPPSAPEESTAVGDAVALFRDRAAAAVPDFAVTAENEAAVARLCRFLEGIPLAIELAARRLRILSVEQIIARLSDRFALLTSGDPSRAPRHRALRTTIGWSHELCTPSERLLWTRLAVFPGDFDLAAVEGVCADGPLTEASVLGLLTRLVDRSVVVSDPAADGVRYRLLDTVRQFAHEWLDSLGERDVLARRHRDHYLSLVERAEQAWFGPNQPRILTDLRREHANLRSALDYSLRTPDEARVGQRMAGGLWFFWLMHGALAEGRLWLDRALALDATPSPDHASALLSASEICVLQGDLAGAKQFAELCRDEDASHRDARATAHAIAMLGVVAQLTGDLSLSRDLFEEFEARHAAIGQVDSRSLVSQAAFSVTLAFLGELDRAQALIEGARATGEAHGDNYALAYGCYDLALISVMRGQHREAVAYAGEGLRQHHAIHNVGGIAMLLELLATITPADTAGAQIALLHGMAEPMWRLAGQRLFNHVQLIAQHDAAEAQARKVIGEEYDAEFQRGARFAIDAAVAHTLDAVAQAG